MSTNQSWLSISNINDDNLRYEQIVNKLKNQFSSDNIKSKLYIDPIAHDNLFNVLKKCMREIDEDVNNHNYDQRYTKNILFVRDILSREFHEKSIKKIDQRLVAFETAAVVLLSMNKRLNNNFFPKYRNLESFLSIYPHYHHLSNDEKYQYMEFANYICVILKFLTAPNNERHIIPIALRITSVKGEEYITGGGKTDKTKRRTEILRTEGGYNETDAINDSKNESDLTEDSNNNNDDDDIVKIGFEFYNNELCLPNLNDSEVQILLDNESSPRYHDNNNNNNNIFNDEYDIVDLDGLLEYEFQSLNVDNH